MSDPQGEGSTWAERNYNMLLFAVIGMGVLIVAGLVLVMVTVTGRISGGERAPVPAGAPALSAPAADLLGTMEVVSASLDGNRLALVLRGPEGPAVMVIDVRTGEVASLLRAR